MKWLSFYLKWPDILKWSEHYWFFTIQQTLAACCLYRDIFIINNTHMEELVLYWIQYKTSLKYKVGCFWPFSNVYTINEVLLIPLWHRCLKNVIHQIDNKNEWLLLSVTFTADLELVFVLTILTRKNLCFTEFSTKVLWNARLAASDVFHMFTRSIKFF